MNISVSKFKAVLLPLLLGLLVACSDGDGGGDGGNDGLSYTGNTSAAKVSNANAPDLVGKLMDSMAIVNDDSLAFRGDGANPPKPASSYLGYAMQQIGLLRDRLLDQDPIGGKSPIIGQRTDFDQTDACDPGSGTVRSSGYLEANFTGVITFDFVDCQNGPDRLDGQLSIQIDAFDIVNFIDTALGFTMANLTLVNPDFNVTVSGQIDYAIDVAMNQETETIHSLVIRDNTTGDMVQILNLVSVFSYDDVISPGTVSVVISGGRIYDSVQGYVEIGVTALSPLDFTNLTQLFPNGGTVFLTADGGIRATALSATSVQIEVDTVNPGDDIYEFTIVLDWTSL